MLFTAQDLEQYGDGGGFKGNAINFEGTILSFHVRVGIGELENGAHIRNVQVDVDVGTAGYRCAGLNQKVLEIEKRETLK